MAIDEKKLDEYLKKWQKILRLQDWDIISRIVNVKWRKSGDIKIDADNRMAVVLINNDGVVNNRKKLVIHESLHLKLWGMDQMIEGYVNIVFGSDEKDKKRDFAMDVFFKELESTVEDLTKGYLEVSGAEKPSIKRLERKIKEEIGQ
ncbi:MAG TPA: hypothetical protein DCM73_06695 [Clostridiales bacterium]|nr:hypothetical protein [Clostridiales bacterium]